VIGHLDLDAFFAAVELHRRPELRGLPLVVGGDPDGRGVVATASYAARAFGIRSAMSCAEARRRCPEVVFVRPDMARYREWSERVWTLVRTLAPEVEQVGIDEGYLLLDDPGEEHATAIQAAVAREVRLSCSLGVATCKVVAKIASDRKKPGGITVVAPGDEASFLAPLPLRTLPGAGPRTAERLAAHNVATIGDLAALSAENMGGIVPGVHGEELLRRARGIDARQVVSEPAERVSISTERTFEKDVGDTAELMALVGRMADDLAASLMRRGRATRTVGIKLRYPDFSTITRDHSLGGATTEAGEIAAVAGGLLTHALRERPAPIRLLGVKASGLSDHAQLRLFGPGSPAVAEGEAPTAAAPTAAR
jgi:DNA polymerase IV